MNRALIVIDVQESFRARPYWQMGELPAFLANTQSLIDRCVARGIPVLQVFHQESGAAATDPFAPASGLVRTLEGLKLAPAAIFHKEVHSAMFARSADGTTLEAWLRDHRIGEIMITGIRTEQCCETTARHASDLGFEVRYITDATLTFPMKRAGRAFSTEEIRERTELVLDGRFAEIVSTADALA
ncbi:MAG TPA: isochorismatase family protein [Steroidobacteraceae bacterium]|nr:isochorismatase family protein [Steroidobacteraceae bacterium]